MEEGTRVGSFFFCGCGGAEVALPGNVFRDGGCCPGMPATGLRNPRALDLGLGAALRHGTGQQHFQTISDKPPDLLQRALRIAIGPQRKIRTVAQVLQRVQQRAVEVK